MIVLPNAVLIGAGRCGSTWIYQCLKEHPDILVPRSKKELQFFNNKNGAYDRGLSWYENQFSHYRGQTAVVDTSGTYLAIPGVEKEIHRHLKHARLLFSLRNPVERAYSSYVGYIMNGLADWSTDFAEVSRRVQNKARPGILEHGLYFRHLSRYLQTFSRNDLCILLFDDLKDDPKEFVRTIYRFLSVDENFAPSCLYTKVNRGRYSPFLKKLNAVGRSFQKSCPTLQRMVEKSVMVLRRSFVRRGNPKMSAELRRQLKEYYREDILQLSGLIGRDLSSWLEDGISPPSGFPNKRMRCRIICG